jgi:hypothetical protein
MLETLKTFLEELRALRKIIKAEKFDRIAKKDLRTKAEQLGSRWFSEFSTSLSQEIGIPSEILDKYAEGCGRLIALSASNNLKASYIGVLGSLIKPFRDELILSIQKGTTTSGSLSLLHKILGELPNPNEGEYLKEAISCAQRGFLRASVVLGWCAAIDRIHRRIEEIGLQKFNITSVQMAGQQKGRFKRFSSPQSVTSLSELREVFDTVVLWIIEGMGMIDTNQHTRLRSCFEMRCQCGHPGEAPITEYNLMSYFSDINEIVFRNSMFQIHQ